MNKKYVYKSYWGKEFPENVMRQWSIVKPYLEREGYRIEIVKVKMSILNSKIIYRFVEEKK